MNRVHKIVNNLQPSVILTSGARLNEKFWKELKQYVINPGTYHYLNNNEIKCSLVQFKNVKKQETFILYSPHAKALRKAGFDGIAQCHDLCEFSDLWDDSKKVVFDDELLAGMELTNQIDYKSDCRYVVYGTGTYGKKALEGIEEIGAEVVFCCDSSEEKQGQLFHGIPVYGPEYLTRFRGNFDKVVIAALAYQDIRKKILEAGIGDGDIVAPIF